MIQHIQDYISSANQKIVFVMFLVVSISAHSQTESFIRSFGVDGFNYGHRVAVLQDTTYMLMGNKTGFNNMNNVYLIHADQAGHIIRDQVFGGTEMHVASDMTVLGDTMFIITGHTLNSTTQDYDVFVMWISRDLELISQKQYSASGWDFGKIVTADQTGNVFVGSESYSYGSEPAILLLHYKPDYNFYGELVLSNPLAEMKAESCIMVDDTLIFLTGSYLAVQEPMKGMILKIKTDFSQIDTLLYGSDTLNIHYTDITHAGTDRISVTGYYTQLNDPVRMLLYHSFDENLTMNGAIWDNVPGTHCNCITASAFGHTAFGCHTTAFGSGNADFHYFRFDHNTYLGASTVGGLMYDEPFDIAFALDSSLIMIGTTQSFGTPVTSIMLAKTCRDYLFCVSDYEHQTHINSMENNLQVLAFPNPATDILNIVFSTETVQAITNLVVFTPDGRMMYPRFSISGHNTVQLHIAGLRQGLYSVRIETDTTVFQTKFIKQ